LLCNAAGFEKEHKDDQRDRAYIDHASHIKGEVYLSAISFASRLLWGN